MLVSKAARRYATALFELAKEQDAIEQTLKDVLFIKNTILDSRELLVFLKSPVVKPDKKAAVLQEIFGDKIGELVHKFVMLIARKNRQNMLHEIVEAYVEKHNQYAGIITAEVFVAHELSDKQKDNVAKRIQEVTGKQVNLTVKVQPSLKGGMAVKIDDTVIDGTVKHKLEQLEDTFLSTATE